MYRAVMVVLDPCRISLQNSGKGSRDHLRGCRNLGVAQCRLVVVVP